MANKSVVVDYFGRHELSPQQLKEEAFITSQRRWNEKLAASKQTGTPPENITIYTMYECY